MVLLREPRRFAGRSWRRRKPRFSDGPAVTKETGFRRVEKGDVAGGLMKVEHSEPIGHGGETVASPGGS